MITHYSQPFNQSLIHSIVDDVDVPLEVINSDVVLTICADECGAKCCDFYLNDFVARVNIEDYKRLKQYDLDNFVVWTHGDPQLAKQPGGKCIFLDPQTRQCSIYSIRPLDCRNYPYFMAEENIADHCLLYYRSSQQLIIEQRAKTHDVPEFTKSYGELDDVEREYIINLQDQPDIDFTRFDNEHFIETSTVYISIIYTDQTALEQALQVLKLHQIHLDEDDYRGLSILGMDDHFDYTFHLLGTIRSSAFTVVDYLDQFPTSPDEVEQLLDWVNHHKYEKLIGGVLIPQKQYDRFTTMTSQYLK